MARMLSRVRFLRGKEVKVGEVDEYRRLREKLAGPEHILPRVFFDSVLQLLGFLKLRVGPASRVSVQGLRQQGFVILFMGASLCDEESMVCNA